LIPIRYSARNLGQRFVASAMTAMSIALVVMVLTILLGFVDGMRRTMTQAAATGNWVVLQRGVSVENGYISHENLQILSARPEVAADASGNALISPELLVGFDPTPDSPQASTAMVRAVLPIAYEVHRGIRIVEGHRPVRGRNEWMVGQRLAARTPTLHPGAVFHWFRTEWRIAGVFSDNGSARESEVWADLDDLATTFHFPRNTVGANVIHLVLRPGEDDSFTAALQRDSRMRVDLMSERAFYAQAAGFSDQLRRLGLVVAIVLAIGSIFGAMNTMYSAVARRQREIGTLRALGFERGSVLTAFMIESAMLGLLGGLIGAALAVIVARLTGLDSRLMNVGSMLFSFRLPLWALAAGIAAAAAIGFAGGLLPAWQASRLDLIDSLRE
jgi:putative ABC transport system permease protein